MGGGERDCYDENGATGKAPAPEKRGTGVRDGIRVRITIAGYGSSLLAGNRYNEHFCSGQSA